MPDTRQTVEPYKISEIFSYIPEFDGTQIFLNTFISDCNIAFTMSADNQQVLLGFYVINKLRVAELLNSCNPTILEILATCQHS